MSSRKINLLLPLYLASAVVLNVYAVLDPTGVYRAYLDKLAPATPPVVVEKAREMDLLIYLKNYEPQELVHSAATPTAPVSTTA